MCMLLRARASVSRSPFSGGRLLSLCLSERQRCLWRLCMLYYIHASNGHNYCKCHLTLSSCQTVPIWMVWTWSCYRFLVSLLQGTSFLSTPDGVDLFVQLPLMR